MSKTLHRLAVKQIEAARTGKALNDGGGLFFRASKSPGAGKWTFRYTSQDAEFIAAQEAKGSATRQRDMGLGTYPAVSLTSARKKATALRAMVDEGLDPIEQDRRVRERAEATAAQARREREADSMTFGRYAEEVFLPVMLPTFRNAAHIQQWRATFATHAAALRDKPLAGITREDVLSVLVPIWGAKNATASRSRERIERLFSHAIQNGQFRGDNPAAWTQFDHTLPRPKKLARGHHAAIPHEQISELVALVRTRQGESISALMLEWIALCACRTGEARFATWAEIDFDRMAWTIPAERMKMRRGHEVPITPRMAEILRDMQARQDHVGREGPFVFSETGAKPLSEMAALMFMRRLPDYAAFTVHGLRATFKTWAATATNFPRELIEEQLAHQLGAVERAYMRGSATERRRPMMEAWADYCDGTSAGATTSNVVPLVSGQGQ